MTKLTEILSTDIQDQLATLLDSYFPEHKDCECSRCLAFIYGLKQAILDWVAEVIGEDEEDPFGDQYYVGRNDLREQQRKRAGL